MANQQILWFKGVVGMYMYIKMIHIMIVDLCNMIITLSILLIAHCSVLPNSMPVYIRRWDKSSNSMGCRIKGKFGGGESSVISDLPN